MSVLEARNLSIRFGGVQAARDVSISLDEWEIVGIIGPNGAGKTTTFNLITGFYVPDTGKVIFKGRDITGLGVHERTSLGLGRTFQNVGLVKGSTVRQNLLTAQYLEADYGTVAGMVGAPQSFLREGVLTDRAEALADLLGLTELLDTQVAGLPYGVLEEVEYPEAAAVEAQIESLVEGT